MASYKEKVAYFRTILEQSVDVAPADQDIGDVRNLEAALKDCIANIPPEGLEAASIDLQNIISQGNTASIKEALDNWCSQLISRLGGRQQPNPRRQPPQTRENIMRKLQQPNLRRNQKRRLEYKLAQYEFQHDQKALADRILDGRSQIGDGVRPTDEDLKNLCQTIFTTPSREDPEPVKTVNPETQEICHPISAEEVTAAIEKNKSDAAGADGLSIKDVKKIPLNQLILLYNSMLLSGYTPTCLKKGRTIFIPKSEYGLEAVNNWRPITIPPILSRIMNKIIMSRLSTVPLNACQRGFSKIDGCFANYATIETLIKARRKKGQPLCLVFLDLSKAFDTVSHFSISRALRRLNIDRKTRAFLEDSYEGCTTTASCNSHIIGEFQVRRGVKQGDPHSPFLFNAVIDELLEDLQERGGVPVGANSKICALAYADDIVLAATNVGDAQRMINESLSFFHKRGLTVNVGKCSTMIQKTVPSKKKVYIATEPLLKVGDEDIPTTTIGGTFTYLGQNFSTSGITTCNAEHLLQQLGAIKKAALKPHQKLCVLNRFLIPRYIASLQRPNVNKRILKEVDKKIRLAVRQILSLSQHSSNNILYAPVKTGGLVIYNFSTNIPLIILSRWERLRGCSPLLEDTYQQSISWVHRLRNLISPDINNKQDAKNLFTSGLESSFSGGLGNVQHHKACRSFINYPPRYWKGSDYIRALQLRYNLLPCKSLPSNPVEERRCRAGCFKNESLSHILQRCPLTHWQRIHRHDFVVKRMKTAAMKRQWSATIEPHIRGRDNLLKKPDLLLKKNNRVIICDVGIHWEGSSTLEEQFQNKVAIYSSEPFIEKLQELHPNCTILILPLIVGARGTWCVLNKAIERELQLDFAEIQDIITTTMRGGWQIHKAFMRSVWRTRRRNPMQQ